MSRDSDKALAIWKKQGGILAEGEREAIATVQKLGDKYGFGNLIFWLRVAWSEKVRNEYGFDRARADRLAGHVCLWCNVDSRTGKKVKRSQRKGGQW